MSECALDAECWTVKETRQYADTGATQNTKVCNDKARHKTGCDASSALYLCDCQMCNRRNLRFFCWSGRIWHIVSQALAIVVKHGTSAVGWDQDTADLDTPDRRGSVSRRRTKILPGQCPLFHAPPNHSNFQARRPRKTGNSRLARFAGRACGPSGAIW
jgi:hypothetical protein